MSDKPKREAQHIAEARAALAEAAAAHVIFDGWSEACFQAALDDSGVDPALAGVACPRGAIDLAVELHRAGDRALLASLAENPPGQMRYSEKVALLVRRRIEYAGDAEMLRKSAALFALPQNLAEGTALVWNTADVIWTALGDTSDDFNWYSKRVILSGVYSSTLLFWLGDDSPDKVKSWAFLDKRIADVMRFEKLKSNVRSTALGRAFAEGPGRLFAAIKAPGHRQKPDLPGHLSAKSRTS